MDWQEEMKRRKSREYAIEEFHRRMDGGKLDGFFCECRMQFSRMEVFKEVYDKWRS